MNNKSMLPQQPKFISDGVAKKKSQAVELFEEMAKDEGEEVKQKQGERVKSRRSQRPLPFRAGLVAVLAAVIVGGAVFGVKALFFNNSSRVLIVPNKKEADKERAGVSQEKSGWQAVFLGNGQVYFGRVGKIDKGFLLMRDIYYLKVQENNSEEIKKLRNSEIEGEANVLTSETRLVKFGTELHKPMDELKINITQVLMIEELSEDSEIVKAIRDYEK